MYKLCLFPPARRLSSGLIVASASCSLIGRRKQKNSLFGMHMTEVLRVDGAVLVERERSVWGDMENVGV